MKQIFPQPLVLHFIWHPADVDKVLPFVQEIKKMLARDIDRPFSRELNIPVFFWNHIQKDVFKNGSPYVGEKNLIFPFVSSNTISHANWKKFYETLPNARAVFHVIPVAIEKGVFHSEGKMRGKNAIRAFDWEGKDAFCRHMLFNVAVAHGIYSFAYANDKRDRARSLHPLTIFFSHCKKDVDGEKVAEKVKEYVQKETTIIPFFDKTAIMAGEEFSAQILTSIERATLVLFETDLYSASHWCQMEIARAKEAQRPILGVDFRNHFEDRVFPGCANIPCIHLRHDILNLAPVESEKEILRVLEAALVETIRCRYNLSRLHALKEIKRIPTSATLLVRPPELSDFAKAGLPKSRKRWTYYPEPSVFQEEADWYSHGLLEARTPLWCSKDIDEFHGLKCGISVSEPDKEEFGEMLQVGHTPDSLQRLIQDVARHLLGRGAKLLFGGDLREKDESGFTRFILDEAKMLRERGIKHFPKIENHLAWPLSIDNENLCHFMADNDTVLLVELYDCPTALPQKIDSNIFLPPDTPYNQYVWAVSLSSMRKQLINRSDIRICAGGRRSGYKGSMPGVLEEVLWGLKEKKPLYLLGGFGGIIQDVVNAIALKEEPESLTEQWQVTHTSGYDEVVKLLEKHGNPVKYKQIVDELHKCSIKNLAKLAGLSVDEYSRLMQTPFVDESLFLILRGIRSLKRSKELKKGRK